MIRSLNRQRFRRASVLGGVAPPTSTTAPTSVLALAATLACSTWSVPAAASDTDDAAPSAAHGPEDPWWGRDKALHLSVSAALAAGGYGLSSLWLDRAWQRASAGAAFALTLGAGKELLDWAGYGHASYKDMLYNFAGTALGVTLAYLVDLATTADPEPERAEPQGLGRARALVVF